MPAKANTARAHVIAGETQTFEVPRDDSGRLRTGQWDRGMTPGVKEKEGVTTEFSPRTFAQMIANWKKRGEPLSLCYNHQSAYAKENGQPAPALAFYDAVCVVEGGRIVQFESLLRSSATRPDPETLADMCRRLLATNENPAPSADGCWWYRSDITDIGEQLLSGFRYLSPMFVTDGQDEQGNEVGYVIFDLAATNTPFQGGCMINFEAGLSGNNVRKGVIRMGKLTKLATLIKFEGDAEDEKAVKAAAKDHMEEEAAKAMEGEDGYGYEESAGKLEEMAKAYEDAKLDEEGDEEAPHLVMRRMAAKMRRMAKLEGEGHEEPDGDEGKTMKEEEETRMERSHRQQYAALASRMGVQISPSASARQIMDAIAASSVPTSQVPALVQAQVSKLLLEHESARAREENMGRAKALVAAAVEGGYPKGNAEALLAWASDPKAYEAAAAAVRGFTKNVEHGLLFNRMTAPGAEMRGSQDTVATGPDRRVVRNQIATFVIDGEKFAATAREWADSKDGAIKQDIDALLSDSEREHAGYRLIAANRLLKQRRPDLWAAAEEQF